MKDIQELKDFLDNGHLLYRAGLTVDCAIFGYHEGELKLLLVKNRVVTCWCLPGGFVRIDENLDQAAARVTAERTGIDNLFLKQFKTFGEPGRGDSKAIDKEQLFLLSGHRLDSTKWLREDTVSVGFYAISDIVHATPRPDVFSTECQWFGVDDLPVLGFDHEEMVREAKATMKMHLFHFSVGKSLLPKKFTLKEIKQFYEKMSDTILHITNFPNKLISLGLIVKTNEKRSIGGHRSPTYYQFDEEGYERALKKGLVLV